MAQRAKRALAVIAALLLAGCEALGIYLHETAGISPVKLAPLYFQEKQYVEDRELEAKLRGALLAHGLQDVEVDVYLKEVVLRGASDAKAIEVARSVRGIASVRAE